MGPGDAVHALAVTDPGGGAAPQLLQVRLLLPRMKA
jgi:hypothetical protein